MENVVKEQHDIFMIPQRMQKMIKSIWLLQYHLERIRPNRILRILEQRYFRAAFDLLELREQAGEKKLAPLVAQWRLLRNAPPEKRQQMIIDRATTK